VVEHELADQIVEAACCDAGADFASDHVEALGRKPPGAAHPGEALWPVQANVARLYGVVSEGGGVLHAVTDTMGLELLCRNPRDSFQLLTPEITKAR
jgi:hypothetical protein